MKRRKAIMLGSLASLTLVAWTAFSQEEETESADEADDRLNYILTNLGLPAETEDEASPPVAPEDEVAETTDENSNAQTAVIDGEAVDALMAESETAVESADEESTGEESAPKDEPAPEAASPSEEPAETQADEEQEEWERFTPFLDTLFEERKIEETEEPNASPPAIPEDAAMAEVDESETIEPETQETTAVPNPPVQEARIETVEPQPRTLDDLLRAAGDSTLMRNQRLLSRLAETERVALAHVATLEAAQSVADYGKAGLELLANASLDDVVETLIQEAERERLDKLEASSEAPKPVPAQIVQKAASSSVADAASVDSKADGFDAWRPTYALRDRHGLQVGWVNDSTGDRRVTVKGVPWMLDDDRVLLTGAVDAAGGRAIQVEVNGEARDVPLL